MKPLKQLVISFFTILILSTFAQAKQYENSCEFTFEKGVYYVTQSCHMNFYIEETILTYGGEPISETAACTYDRDIGPMGFEEADKVYGETYSKLFNEDNNPRASATIDFNEAGNRIEAYTSLHFDDASESGELLIDEISTKVFSIGAMTFNLNNPPLLQIGFDDTLDIYMNGECSGPYFEASENPVNKHINTCTSLGFTKGTEKHGDCVMKLLG